jgi:hypothetical protein
MMRRNTMAIDTLIAYAGANDSVADAEADDPLVKDLHIKSDPVDGYEAAVVEPRAGGKTKIVGKHATPTSVGGVLGGGVAGRGGDGR